MLSYKLIKRKFKLNDSNIADFFGYKNRLAFFTSSLKDTIMMYMERSYDRYLTGGVKGAADYIYGLTWPPNVSPERKQQYRAGLYEFIDVVNFQTKEGDVRDPINRMTAEQIRAERRRVKNKLKKSR